MIQGYLIASAAFFSLMAVAALREPRGEWGVFAAALHTGFAVLAWVLAAQSF